VTILEDINVIQVSPGDLGQAMSLHSSSADSDARMLSILGYVQKQGAEEAAGMALAIGWRLQALEFFLASAEGARWKRADLNEASPTYRLLMECAVTEPLVERDRRPRFDHNLFASRLLQATSEL
jgi:hypothetical protein